MNFSTIKSLVAGQSLRLRSLNPMRDWSALLVIVAIALIGSVMWNVWTFERVINGEAIGSLPAPVASFTEAPDQATLNTAHAIFEKRATEEAKYVTGIYHYTDPSQ